MKTCRICNKQYERNMQKVRHHGYVVSSLCSPCKTRKSKQKRVNKFFTRVDYFLHRDRSKKDPFFETTEKEDEILQLLNNI